MKNPDMDITQNFYDQLAPQYDKLFRDWQATTRRQELTDLFMEQGCCVQWLFPEETGFYQPIIIAKYHPQNKGV